MTRFASAIAMFLFCTAAHGTYSRVVPSVKLVGEDGTVKATLSVVYTEVDDQAARVQERDDAAYLRAVMEDKLVISFVGHTPPERRFVQFADWDLALDALRKHKADAGSVYRILWEQLPPDTRTVIDSGKANTAEQREIMTAGIEALVAHPYLDELLHNTLAAANLSRVKTILDKNWTDRSVDDRRCLGLAILEATMPRGITINRDPSTLALTISQAQLKSVGIYAVGGDEDPISELRRDRVAESAHLERLEIPLRDLVSVENAQRLRIELHITDNAPFSYITDSYFVVAENRVVPYGERLFGDVGVWFPRGLAGIDKSGGDVVLNAMPINLALGTKLKRSSSAYAGFSIIVNYSLEASDDNVGTLTNAGVGVLIDCNNWFYVGRSAVYNLGNDDLDFVWSVGVAPDFFGLP